MPLEATKPDASLVAAPSPGELAEPEAGRVVPVFVVEPRQGLLSLDLGDVWEYRELFYFFVWRDLKVRYKQTLLGVVWTVLQPVLAMLVFTVLFGILVKVPSDGVPYPIYAFAALLPWNLFQRGLQGASLSLVANQTMIRKVYFPRIILPLSSILAALVDFGIAFLVLVVLMAWYKVQLSSRLLYLPAFVLAAFLCATAVSLWLSALYVRYRDVGHALPFLTQIWFYLTPVIYSSSLIPEAWRVPYSLNPMVGVIDGFRWALFAKGAAPGLSMAISFCVSLVLILGGLYYFRSSEQTFADLV